MNDKKNSGIRVSAAYGRDKSMLALRTRLANMTPEERQRYVKHLRDLAGEPENEEPE